MEQVQPTTGQLVRRAAANAVGLVVASARRVAKAAIAGFRWAGDQVPEVLLLGGAAAMTYGVWQIHRPVGWIAGGCLALVAGWRLGRPASEVKRG